MKVNGGQLVRTNDPLLAKNNSSYFGRPGTHVSSSAVVAGSPTLLTLLLLLLLLTLLLPRREEREERTELAPALPADFSYFLSFSFFAASWFFIFFIFFFFYCQLVMIERYESCCHKGSLDHNDEAHY